MSLVRLRPEAPRCRNTGAVCGRSSSGRARPCQGRGSEFEPRRPLQNTTLSGGVFSCAPRRSPSCQPADGGCRSRQPGHFLESASLHPPQAALRRFPRRPLQKEHPIRQDGVFFLEMCRSTGELAASTCAKRVKSRGEAGFLRMATAIRGMPGSEFEPRRPLQNTTLSGGVFSCAPRRSPSCQPADGGCRSRQPGHFLESASLHPPQAALRRFPRRPLQKEHPIRQDGVFFLEMCRGIAVYARCAGCQTADTVIN